MPVTENIEVLKKELDHINTNIAAVERRKLITIIEGGASDKVLFVEPFDLRGKDPLEMVSVYKREVKTDESQGYKRHTVSKIKTQSYQQRWETQPQQFQGPFGPTHKIDATVTDGKRELEEFKRVLEMHVSRLQKVPSPIAYHSEVNDVGMLDLRNFSIEMTDVPVARLENYKPLEDLKNKRRSIMEQLGEDIPEETPETKLIEKAQEHIFKCPHCDFVSKKEHGLKIHISRTHKGI